MNGKDDLYKLNGFSGPHPPTEWTSPLIYRGDIFVPFPYQPVEDSPPDDLAHQFRWSEGGQLGVPQAGGEEELRDGEARHVPVLGHQPVDPGDQPEGVGQPGEVCQLGGPAVGGGHHVYRPGLASWGGPSPVRTRRNLSCVSQAEESVVEEDGLEEEKEVNSSLG